MVFDLQGYEKQIYGKQAKGLKKFHLQDCLVDAIEKKQHTRAAAI
jgi:hypothetical protein